MPIIDNEFEILYVFLFKEIPDQVFYFLKLDKEKTFTFSQERVLIYTGVNENGITKITPNVQNRSACGNCMDAVENDFTDSLVGWIYWNANPQVQALAAGLCYTCTRWGKPCPAAYPN